MRQKILTAALFIAVTTLAFSGAHACDRAAARAAVVAQEDRQDKGRDHNYGGDAEFNERDELRQSYTLTPGAQVRVSGINGRVELKFDGALNADLAVNGINGATQADMPNVTIQGRVRRTNFNAKIGAGGSPLNVSGVNGSVRLAPRM